MTYLVYFLCVYGISFYTSTHFEDQKEYLLIKLTINPTLYRYAGTILHCQACQSFWLGWIVQYFVFGSILPLYAFACFGLVHLINKIKD